MERRALMIRDQRASEASLYAVVEQTCRRRSAARSTPGGPPPRSARMNLLLKERPRTIESVVVSTKFPRQASSRSVSCRGHRSKQLCPALRSSKSRRCRCDLCVNAIKSSAAHHLMIKADEPRGKYVEELIHEEWIAGVYRGSDARAAPHASNRSLEHQKSGAKCVRR